MSEANKRQVGGEHYKVLPLEHWDLVALYGWDYFQGQITRYMMRWRTKDGIKDLEKMAHVAQKYVEIEKLRAEGKLTLSILRDAMSKLMKELNDDELNSLAEHAASLSDGAERRDAASKLRAVPDPTSAS